MKDKMIFGDKIEGVEYFARTGVYGVAEDKEGRAAVVRLPTGYFLIGGGIEQEESRHEALEREFLEETGYSIDIREYIGTSCGYYYSQDFARYMFGTGYFYKVKMLGKTAEPVEADHTLVFLDKGECVKLLNYDYQRWAAVRAFGL